MCLHSSLKIAALLSTWTNWKCKVKYVFSMQKIITFAYDNPLLSCEGVQQWYCVMEAGVEMVGWLMKFNSTKATVDQRATKTVTRAGRHGQPQDQLVPWRCYSPNNWRTNYSCPHAGVRVETNGLVHYDKCVTVKEPTDCKSHQVECTQYCAWPTAVQRSLCMMGAHKLTKENKATNTALFWCIWYATISKGRIFFTASSQVIKLGCNNSYQISMTISLFHHHFPKNSRHCPAI